MGEAMTKEKKKSQISEVFGRLRKNKMAMVGLGMFLLLCLIAIFADVIIPYDYTKMDPVNKFQPPSFSHPFGTDAYGRDLFSRVIYGTRYSLVLGLSAALISTFAGIVFGSIAGFFGGRVENIILRIMDVVQSIPGILLNICMCAALGPGFGKTIIALSIGGIAGKTRMMRASILSIRELEYLEASTAINCTRFQIIFKHIIPNAVSPLIVSTTMGIGGMIMAASGLSFLGLGVQEPTPEWGALLSGARTYLRYYPWLCIFPGLMIAFTVFAINMLGDGLRDAMDPKLKN